MLSNRNPLDPFLGIKHKAWMILHALQANEPLKRAVSCLWRSRISKVHLA